MTTLAITEQRTLYAFPQWEKEPLDTEKHVRAAIAYFLRVQDPEGNTPSDDARDKAWARIKTAAKHYGIDVEEDNWRELGKDNRAVATITRPAAKPAAYQMRAITIPLRLKQSGVSVGAAATAFMDTSGDLALINQMARRELTLDDVYIFYATVSGTMADAMGTIQSDASLATYVQNFSDGDGLPLLENHDKEELPLGRSFKAALADVADPISGMQMRNALGEPLKELLVGFYILRNVILPDGVSSDSIISRIDAGIIRSMSISFLHTIGLCTICGQNKQAPNNCPHISLMQYTTDNSATPVTCYERVMDGWAVEASIVWLGAAPGTYVKRALELHREGVLSADVLTEIEMAAALDTTEQPMSENPTNQPTNPTPTDLDLKVVIGDLLSTASDRAGKTISAGNLAKLQAAHAAMQDGHASYEQARAMLCDMMDMALAQDEPDGDEAAATAETNRALESVMGAFQISDRAQLMPTITQSAASLQDLAAVRSLLGNPTDLQAEIRKLQFNAVIGETYHNDLVTELEKARNRRFGAEAAQSRDLWARTYPVLDIAQLREFGRQWEAETQPIFAEPNSGKTGERQLTPTPIADPKTVTELAAQNRAATSPDPSQLAGFTRARTSTNHNK